MASLYSLLISDGASNLIVILVFLSPFIVPYLVKQVKKEAISDAQAIKKKYPDGTRKVMGYNFFVSGYKEARAVIDHKIDIISAQRQYDDEQKRIAKQKEIASKAFWIRRQCPDVTSNKTDEFIAEHESELRKQQEQFEKKRSEVKSFVEAHEEAAKKVCPALNGWSRYGSTSLSATVIDQVLANRNGILAEQRRIDERQAELARLSPELRELEKKYPLAVGSILSDRNWSRTNLEDVKQLLLVKSSFPERQIVEEKKLLQDRERQDTIIKQIKPLFERRGAQACRTRLVSRYGETVAAVILERIETDNKFASLSAFLDSIETAQNDFADESYSLIQDCLPGWGYYRYDVKNTYHDDHGNAKNTCSTVWQAFLESCCLDDTVSYEYYPDLKDNRISKKQLEESYTYNEQVWDKVLSLILRIREKYGDELYVVLTNTDKLSDDAFANNFSGIVKKLTDEHVAHGRIIPIDPIKTKDRKYVVIDLITENKNLTRICESLFSFRYGNLREMYHGNTGVVYISLLKCFDGKEVESLNQKVTQERELESRRAREEEERRRQEALQHEREANDITRAKTIARNSPSGFKRYFPELSAMTVTASEARAILQKESSISEYETFLTRIKSSVSGWGTVHGVPHYFFYYYYPVRFQNVSTDSEEARRLVYRFKDGADHERVKDLVISKLRSTFSSSDLSQMTFVCIPASTISVNRSRYEAFSREVCSSLDMWNGFEHIAISREKTPSHLGGTDSAEYSFDRSFFKDKHVILFDDIVTRGGSVSSMKTNLESLGARVICAISIGRTFSDWNGQTPQPHPYTGRR